MYRVEVSSGNCTAVTAAAAADIAAASEYQWIFICAFMSILSTNFTTKLYMK